MTRLAVLSDIHGNLPALEAVMDDMAAFTVDQVVVAGDSVNWGPFSAQVMEIITRNHWSVIRGNNEYYLLDYDTPRAPESWRVFTMPPILHEQLGDHWTNVIAGLPDTLSLRFRDAPPLRVVHGIPNNPWQAITPNTSDEMVRIRLTGVGETMIIGGHSHIAMDRQVDGWHILNPGSVGVPLDGSFSASYMIIESNTDGWTVIAQRRVPFDVDILLREFERQQFIDRCGVQARLVVEEFRSARMRLDPFVNWLKATYPGEKISDTRLDEFLLSDVESFVPELYRVV
jgi:predicted phosphodiesterase